MPSVVVRILVVEGRPGGKGQGGRGGLGHEDGDHAAGALHRTVIKVNVAEGDKVMPVRSSWISRRKRRRRNRNR
jgi:hypothetical protein